VLIAKKKDKTDFWKATSVTNKLLIILYILVVIIAKKKRRTKETVDLVLSLEHSSTLPVLLKLAKHFIGFQVVRLQRGAEHLGPSPTEAMQLLFDQEKKITSQSPTGRTFSL
jgi:hypothetical protein